MEMSGRALIHVDDKYDIMIEDDSYLYKIIKKTGDKSESISIAESLEGAMDIIKEIEFRNLIASTEITIEDAIDIREIINHKYNEIM